MSFNFTQPLVSSIISSTADSSSTSVVPMSNNKKNDLSCFFNIAQQLLNVSSLVEKESFFYQSKAEEDHPFDPAATSDISNPCSTPTIDVETDLVETTLDQPSTSFVITDKLPDTSNCISKIDNINSECSVIESVKQLAPFTSIFQDNLNLNLDNINTSVLNILLSKVFFLVKIIIYRD